MILENKDHLIFDLDGTLIDSVPDLTTALNCMAKRLNLDSFDEDTVRTWVGNGASILVKRALSRSKDISNSINEEYFNEALEIFFECYQANLCKKTKLFEGVLETLETLKKRGYKMSIVTNKPSKFTTPIIKELDIKRYFDVVIGADDLPLKKPDPMPLIEAIKRVNSTNEASVMVGDSKNDILAAKSAEVTSVGVTYGYNYDTPISEYNPDIVIDDIRELLDILEAK